MKIKALFLLLFCAVCGAAYSQEGDRYVPDEVLVAVNAEDDDAGIHLDLLDVGISLKRIGSRNVHLVKLHPRVTVEGAIELLNHNPKIRFAEPNYIGYPASTPNDPDYTSQYGTAKVSANLAWNIWQPQTNVVIAVIDSGVNKNHTEFAGKLFQEQAFFAQGQTSDANDVNGHGSHVAGIAAARINNGAGIAGIAGWNGVSSQTDSSNIYIMPIRVLNENNANSGITYRNSDLVDAIEWAVDKKAPTSW